MSVPGSTQLTGLGLVLPNVLYFVWFSPSPHCPLCGVCVETLHKPCLRHRARRWGETAWCCRVSCYVSWRLKWSCSFLYIRRYIDILTIATGLGSTVWWSRTSQHFLCQGPSNSAGLWKMINLNANADMTYVRNSSDLLNLSYHWSSFEVNLQMILSDDKITSERFQRLNFVFHRHRTSPIADVHLHLLENMDQSERCVLLS